MPRRRNSKISRARRAAIFREARLNKSNEKKKISNSQPAEKTEVAGELIPEAEVAVNQEANDLLNKPE